MRETETVSRIDLGKLQVGNVVKGTRVEEDRISGRPVIIEASLLIRDCINANASDINERQLLLDGGGLNTFVVGVPEVLTGRYRSWRFSEVLTPEELEFDKP